MELNFNEDFDNAFNEMDMTFLLSIVQESQEDAFKLIQEEVYSDCIDLTAQKVIALEDDGLTGFKYQVFPYTFKYCFILNYLESMELFEECAWVKQAFIIMANDVFNIKMTEIANLMIKTMKPLKDELGDML